MANASDYLEDAVLDHILGTTAYTMPTVYLALFSSDPADDASGTEVTGGSYARQAISFAASSGGSATNSTAESFSMPTVVVTHWALYDASTAGNLLVHGSFSSSTSVTSGDTFYVNAGSLTVTLA